VIEVLREHRRRQLETRLMLGQGRPSGDEPVFPGASGGYDGPRAFSLRWGRKAAALGMPEVTWHALRHACASLLLADRSVPLTATARRLGHANVEVTLRVYAHEIAGDDSAAAAALDRALGEGGAR
jgi:integrase